jgi:HEAT repeat protein
MKPAITFLVLTSLVVGCQNKGNVKMPKPPAPPPPAPPRVDKPIDAGLQRDAEAELARAFASEDVFLRANAVEASQKAPSDATRRLILAALEDNNSVVRFAGTMAAGNLRMQEARDRLNALTTDRDRSVQVGSRYALHRLGDYRLSHDLEAYAADDDPSIRANTVLVLGLLGEPSAKKILNSMTRDFSPSVQLQVLEARYRLGDKEATEKLIAGTLSSAPDDQIISLLALGTSKDIALVPTMRAKLTNDYPEVALAAARALGMVGSDAGMGVALKYIAAPDQKDPQDPTVNMGARRRALAALALGEIGRTDAQPQLGRLLKDNDPGVRLAAATAILQLRANAVAP